MNSDAGKPGKIIAIGGAENKTPDGAILRRVLHLAPQDRRAVAVVTTASGFPDETFAPYAETFAHLGASDVHHVNVRERADASDPAFLEMIRGAGVIFVSGGDQLRLTTVLGGSPLMTAIRENRESGGLFAGTSAGAAAMSATMIYDGSAIDALRRGGVKMTAGLGFVDGVVIDSHFLARGRFTRLMEVCTTSPEFLGIGLDEDAAVVVHDDTILEAVGSGHVIVTDCAGAEFSDVTTVAYGEPIAVSDVKMHALTEGYGYDLAKRRFLRTEELQAILAEDRS